MKPYEIARAIFDCSNYRTAGKDLQYKIIKSDDVNYLLFQGTCSKLDVMLDARFLPKTYLDIKAHKGFVEGWESAKSDVFQNVPKDKPLIVAGHSMGAGYATLACYGLFKEKGLKAEKLVIFGTPRIFVDAKSRDRAKAGFLTVESYENRMDVVPTVPPFYFKFDGIKVGEKFSLFKWFQMEKNHLCYPNEDLYK